MTRGTDVTDFKNVYRTAKPGEFPVDQQISLQKKEQLRYGENPNQSAAVYSVEGQPLSQEVNVRLLKTGKQGLSATNYQDVCKALGFLKFFSRPAVAVMKHLIPSGFAKQTGVEDLDELYRRARDADRQSAFGSFVAFNRQVDLATATELMTTFVEGVVAPSFTSEAVAKLNEKPDLRVVLYDGILTMPKFVGDMVQGVYHFKSLDTGEILAQTPYLSRIRNHMDFVTDPLIRKPDGTSVVVARDPTQRETDDLQSAWYVLHGGRSNGIALLKNGTSLAIGAGKQERVRAVIDATVTSYQKAMDRAGIVYDPLDGAKDRHSLSYNPLEGAVLASDGFFPFADSVEILGRCGVSAVIQPGGSKNDAAVIEAANRYNMAMVFTLERCFIH